MRRLKVANILLWSGTILLIVGLGLIAPRLSLYASTFLATNQIPTAPVLPPSVAADPQDPVLLPFVEEVEAVVEEEDLAILPPQDATSTIAPTPAPTSAAEQEGDEPQHTATPRPSPTAAPVWEGTTPVQVRIPSIRLDAPVVPIGWTVVRQGGQQYALWDVPDWRAAGWHNTSAPIGVPGNTVLNGHNATRGEVFRDLYKVEIGAVVEIVTEDGDVYTYRVAEKYILPEAGQPLDVRMQNARYIQDTADERLTFVTCHPYGSLANRLLVIAFPDSEVDLTHLGAD